RCRFRSPSCGAATGRSRAPSWSSSTATARSRPSTPRSTSWPRRATPTRPCCPRATAAGSPTGPRSRPTSSGSSMPRALTLAVLIGLLAVAGDPTAAQTPAGGIEERVLLDNDSVRLALITYPPGADSDLHFNVGPEVTIVQEGQLVLFAQGRRE